MNNYGDSERRMDFEYFKECYNELFKKHGHKFIAIKNKEIIGIYETEIEAIEEVTKTYPLGSFIVQECNGNESGYTNYISSWQLVSV